jgi:hypothetical protein
VMPKAPVPASTTLSGPAGDPHLALVTVEVAFAPPQIELAFSAAAPDDRRSADRNLFASRPGINVFTYSALIGRGL